MLQHKDKGIIHDPEFLRLSQVDGLAQVPPCKCRINLGLAFLNPQGLYQIFPYYLVPQRLQLQLHAARQDGREECVLVGCQQQDDRIGRRLLNGF